MRIVAFAVVVLLAGGVAPAGVARSLSPAPNAELRAISCSGVSRCAVVGRYQDKAGISFPLIEQWNGAKWSLAKLNRPRVFDTGALEGVSCVGATFCVATGWYKPRPGAHSLSLIQAWRGGPSWSPIAGPVAPKGYDMSLQSISCLSANDCYGGGFERRWTSGGRVAEHWNGSRWTVLPLPRPQGRQSSLWSLSCRGADHCLAVEHVVKNGGQTSQVESLVGGRLSVIGPVHVPKAQQTLLWGSSCVSSRYCWVVGVAYRRSGSHPVTALYAKGKLAYVAPRKQAGKLKNFSLLDVSCVSAKSCMAIGPYTIGNAPGDTGYRWNGVSWSPVRMAAAPRGWNYTLNAVACSGRSLCLAAGTRGHSGGYTLMEMWNGAKWRVMPSPNPAV